MEDKSYKSREELVYHTLKKDILDLKLKPGQLVKENEICERFSVSRTPVRDALRFLQAEGFIVMAPYRGIFVTRLSLSNIRQMIYMRIAVESMVMKDFSEIATPMMMEDIWYMLRKQEAVIREKNFEPEMFYRLDSSMHSLWFEATHKSKLWNILQEQQLHYTRFRMLDFATETDFTRIIQEHRQLIILLEKKELTQMEVALKEHLHISMKRMRHQIEVEYRDYFEPQTEGGDSY